jgi:hypothetical protein
MLTGMSFLMKFVKTIAFIDYHNLQVLSNEPSIVERKVGLQYIKYKFQPTFSTKSICKKGENLNERKRFCIAM